MLLLFWRVAEFKRPCEQMRKFDTFSMESGMCRKTGKIKTTVQGVSSSTKRPWRRRRSSRTFPPITPSVAHLFELPELSHDLTTTLSDFLMIRARFTVPRGVTIQYILSYRVSRRGNNIHAFRENGARGRRGHRGPLSVKSLGSVVNSNGTVVSHVFVDY